VQTWCGLPRAPLKSLHNQCVQTGKARAEAECACLRAETGQLRRALDEAQAAAAACQSDAAAARSSLTVLEGRLADAELLAHSTTLSAAARVSDVEAELRLARDELEAVRREGDALVEAVRQAASDREAALQAEVESQRDASQRAATEYERSVTEATTVVRELRARMAAVEAECATYRAMFASAETEMAAVAGVAVALANTSPPAGVLVGAPSTPALSAAKQFAAGDDDSVLSPASLRKHLLASGHAEGARRG